MKTKKFKIHTKKGTYPISSIVKLHTKKFEDPQNDKKKIKDSKTSKYKNKKISKFTRRKANTPSPPLQSFAQIFLRPTK
jgi:hypothetical protein